MLKAEHGVLEFVLEETLVLGDEVCLWGADQGLGRDVFVKSSVKGGTYFLSFLW